MKTNKILILVLLVVSAGLLVTLIAPEIVSAQSGAKDAIEEGTNAAGNTTGGANAESVVQRNITNAVNLFTIVVGIVAVIMIIVGGLRYVTSSGDATKIGNAKNTIMYAIIGLIVAALSQIITRFTLNTFG